MNITKIIENSEKKYFTIYIKYGESLMWSDYANSDYDIIKEYFNAIKVKYNTFYSSIYNGDKEIDISSPEIYSKVRKFICILDNFTNELMGGEVIYKFDSDVAPKGVELN